MLLQRFRDCFVIGKGQYAIPDDLASFVAFAGDDEHVPWAEVGDGPGDRGRPVGDFDDLRGARRRVRPR